MISYNVHYNLLAWTNHTFVLAERCSNLGNAYQCTTAGTSTSGPTGTGSSINNGGVAVFKWLSAIDYTSLAAWSAAIVASYSIPGLPDNLTAQVWNNGVISIPVGSTNLLSLFNTSNNGHTVLITAAAGESFRDKAGAASLAWSAANGVAFDIAAGTEAGNQFIYIDSLMQNVTISGLQFRDTNAPGTAAEIMINMGGNGGVVQDCIFDGYDHFYTGANKVGLVNCIVINRCSTPLTAALPVKWDTSCTGAYVVNCIFIATAGGGGPGSIVAGLNSTAATATARNCAFFGASTPILAQNITGQWVVDHCLFDVTASAAISAPANGWPLTDGGGNLYSAVATNQFISSTTDFRPKIGAATIGAGVVDTTHNPAGDDIFRVARGAVWDIGDVEYNPVLASAALAIIHPVAVGSAAQSLQSAHAIDQLPALSSVIALGRSLNASTAVFIATLSRNIAAGQSDQVSAAVPVVLHSTAVAIVNIQASAAVSLGTLTALGFLNDAAATLATVPPLACVGAMVQQIGDANAFGVASVNVAATASMSSVTTVSGTASIIIQPVMSAGQADQASTTVSFVAIADVATASQFDLSSAVVALLPMVSVATVGNSASVNTRVAGFSTGFSSGFGPFNNVVGFFSLTVVATAAILLPMAGQATLLTIAIPSPVRPELQADPSASIFLVADGSGLILRADVPRARTLSESTNTSVTAAIPPLVAVGLAFESDVASTARNIANMAAVASLGQADLATGSPAIVLAVSGQAVQQRAMNALATVASLQAVSAAGQSDVATSSVALALAASGAAGQVDQAHATLSINVAVVASGGPTLTGAGLATVPPLAAVAAMANVNGATGSARISVTSSGLLGQQANVSGTDSVATLVVVASARLQTTTSATVAIPALTSVAALGQSEGATGSGTIVLGAAGNVQNLLISASALAIVPPLAVVATASISGAKMSATGTIIISAASVTGQANFAATIASLAVLAETNATLYVSPIGYETGVDVVFWPA